MSERRFFICGDWGKPDQPVEPLAEIILKAMPNDDGADGLRARVDYLERALAVTVEILADHTGASIEEIRRIVAGGRAGSGRAEAIARCLTETL